MLQLAAQAADGQRVPGTDGKVAEADSLGESSASCAAGTGVGMTAGAAGWTALTQAAGSYELVSNLKSHIANGMHHELDVHWPSKTLRTEADVMDDVGDLW